MKKTVLSTPAMIRENLLLERAARLANRQGVTLSAPSEQIVLFEVEGHLAGLHARDCTEIVKIDLLTPVPDAAPGLLGLLNIQNNFHCLIDARPLILGKTSVPDAAFVFAIVLRHDTLKVALACDLVLRVENITETNTGDSGSFRIEDRFATMIDLPTLLAPYESEPTQV